MKPITGRIQFNHEMKTIGDTRFSPKVHVLAGTLVPVVSTYTSWFGG
jgi:hypothetical protein